MKSSRILAAALFPFILLGFTVVSAQWLLLFGCTDNEQRTHKHTWADPAPMFALGDKVAVRLPKGTVVNGEIIKVGDLVYIRLCNKERANRLTRLYTVRIHHVTTTKNGGTIEYEFEERIPGYMLTKKR